MAHNGSKADQNSMSSRGTAEPTRDVQLLQGGIEPQGGSDLGDPERSRVVRSEPLKDQGRRVRMPAITLRASNRHSNTRRIRCREDS